MRLTSIATFVAPALIAGAAFLTLSLSPRATLAEEGSHHRNAENTFTKWVTGGANMAGVVGGDVGRGTFVGEVLSFTGANTPEDPALIHARYEFHGRFRSFTADVHVTQIFNKAVIIGVVTGGWLQGNIVEGEYTAIQCTHDNMTTDCFRGTLDILRGTEP